MSRALKRPPTRPLHIAITGMNARADNPGPGLAVARCLRQWRGDHLHLVGLSYDALDPGLYHPDCDASYLLPYPSAGCETLLGRLLEIHEKEGLDVLIPCLDAELPSFVALAPQLAEAGIACLLPTEQQLQMRDKSRLSELTLDTKLPYPETRQITHAGFFHACEGEGWSYPFVVKGPFYDAHVVHNKQEAVEAFRKISSTWGLPILVQRFVAGEEYNLTGVGDGEGNLLAPVMMKKRGLTDKGKAWAGICVHDQALLEAAESLMQRMQWRGPLEIEVMRDPKGLYNLIEINPRFPAWIYLSAGVGRNLPALLVSRLMGIPTPEIPPPQVGTMFIRYAQELILPQQDFETMMIHGLRSSPSSLSV